MGLFDKLRGELIDIVQWLPEQADDLMVWRFPKPDSEIKYGAQLIVRESQVAAFVNEGQLADVYAPGQHTLVTQNMPILSKLQGWKYGFESPFKAEVYFVSTRTFNDRKWGTKNPIMMRDAEFGPVRLRAFGNFQVKVSDPAAFLRQIVGTDARFTTEQLDDQVRDMVAARFADLLAESKIPVLDLAANQDELGKFMLARIQPDFDPFGLTILKLFVENISLPEEVEKALDKRTSMGVMGNLQAYTQFQVANAIGDAAKNPGGLGALGASVGLGAAVAQQMAGSMNAPPPLPSSWMVEVDGKQAGPFDSGKLASMAGGGQLTRQTLVWKSGMADWKPAETTELVALFANVPPPLPKR